MFIWYTLGMADATRELSELVRQRDRMFGLLQERRALGGFDANAGSILALMEANLAIINYLIVLASKPESRAKPKS